MLSERYSTKSRPFLVLTGGEPLLHDDLPAIVESIHAEGFGFGMVTNGWRLDGNLLQKLLSHRINSITVSLDGLEAQHDWLRGRKGAFRRARRAISLLSASPIPLFDVVTCVTPRNLDALPELLEFLRANGVERWRLFNIFPKGRARKNPDLICSDDELRRMFAWIRDTRKELAKSDFHLDFSCEGYLPKALDAAVRDEPYFCRAGIAIGSVLSDGAIAACPNISRELVQGNIREDDFIDVWENRYTPFRNRRWMRQGECTECGDWRRCKGNSLHLWNADKGETERCYLKILTDSSSRS
jgi:radical SAM protein with 4Fe4S-binding SPASM domain